MATGLETDEPERVSYRPPGPAWFISWNAFAALLGLMAIAALVQPERAEPSFRIGMPIFAAVFFYLSRWFMRPVIVEADPAAGTLRILRPRPWPFPPAVRSVPLADILYARLDARKSAWEEVGDRARIVLVLHERHGEIPLSRWVRSQRKRLEPTAEAISALVKKHRP